MRFLKRYHNKKLVEFAGLCFIFGTILLLYSLSLQAHIIEPDNIIYGEIFNTQDRQLSSGYTVTIEVNQMLLDSYTLGDNPSAGDYYILRVPLDSGQPLDNNRAHTGDTATIRINGQEVLKINDISGHTITIGSRGTVMRKKLTTGVCVPTNGGVEACDGIDNNCDGHVDEYLVQPCSNACGVSGTETCVNGQWVNCNAPPVPVEMCDGEDNDCDSQVDEDLVRSCSTDLGTGTETCVYGQWVNCTAPLPDVDFEMNLSAGWSMISLPVNIPDATLSTLFPGAAVIYRFEGGTGYVSVLPNEELQAGEGYWIFVYGDQNYVLPGQPITFHSKTVYSSGWEMIGGCTSRARATAYSCDIGVIYRFVKEVGYQRVIESEAMEPGEGFWILTREVADQCELMVEPVGNSL